MRNTEERKTGTAVFLAIGAAAVLWLSLLLAPCLGGGLPQMIPKLGDALSHPFRLSFCGVSVPTALILLAVYGLVILVCHYTKPNYRRREETVLPIGERLRTLTGSTGRNHRRATRF